LLENGDVVEIEGPLPTEKNLRPVPEPDQPLTLIHADRHLVVVAKPAGIPTQPIRPGERGTLASAVVARFPDCLRASPDPRDGGFVQRLDRDTSGVIIAARSRKAWEQIRASFRKGAVEKTYLALVAGSPPESFVVEYWIAPYPGDKRRVIAVPSNTVPPEDALSARTEVKVLRRFTAHALVAATTRTGRRHQIRAHLAAAGYTLLGDPLYGPTEHGASGELTPAAGEPTPAGTEDTAPEARTALALPQGLSLARHLLHASRITLPHPEHGGLVTFEAPLPDEAERILAALAMSSH